MKNKNTRYLFVYGSLMSSFRNPWSAYLHRHSRLLGKASAQGRIYDIKGYPGMVESQNSQERVTGEVYLMSSLNLLWDLDEYEECFMKYPEKSQFVRKVVDVNLPDGKKLEAWTYFYNREPRESSLIPDGVYSRYYAR